MKAVLATGSIARLETVTVSTPAADVLCMANKNYLPVHGMSTHCGRQLTLWQQEDACISSERDVFESVLPRPLDAKIYATPLLFSLANDDLSVEGLRVILGAPESKLPPQTPLYSTDSDSLLTPLLDNMDGASSESYSEQEDECYSAPSEQEDIILSDAESAAQSEEEEL